VQGGYFSSKVDRYLRCGIICYITIGTAFCGNVKGLQSGLYTYMSEIQTGGKDNARGRDEDCRCRFRTGQYSV
jgi:hypothetical protein